MSVPSMVSEGGMVEGRDALVRYLEAGSKPPTRWRIGTEHEKFAFRFSDLRPLPYDGPDGIAALLQGIAGFGWDEVHEGDRLIGLSGDGASVSLEPGGQLELSGAPLGSLHQTCDELQEHLRQTRLVCQQLGIGLLGLGALPKWTLDEVPWMPKGRYRIMRDYMPRVGTRGLDMMKRTCTVQVNLDFGSEADMVQKLRIGLALQPIATALFANSPFLDGKPTGWLSERARIWLDTDRQRTGGLDLAFEDGFGFDRYVDYALDVPMYFVYRDGTYIDVAGQSFRDFLEGRLPGLPGERPRMSDWADHLTTLFPDVRLKHFLEMRGADGGPWERICALPALWVGLLYDAEAQDAALQVIDCWEREDRAKLREEVPRIGFKARIRGRTVQDVALEVLEIARGGLQRRARLDGWNKDETHFLDTLSEIALSGQTMAERLTERYFGHWGRSVDPVFQETAY